jgi:hypothetical protein
MRGNPSGANLKEEWAFLRECGEDANRIGIAYIRTNVELSFAQHFEDLVRELDQIFVRGGQSPALLGNEDATGQETSVVAVVAPRLGRHWGVTPQIGCCDATFLIIHGVSIEANVDAVFGVRGRTNLTESGVFVSADANLPADGELHRIVTADRCGIVGPSYLGVPPACPFRAMSRPNRRKFYKTSSCGWRTSTGRYSGDFLGT